MTLNREVSLRKPDVVVCGHISVDIIPEFRANGPDSGRLTPGNLVEVGAAGFCTGGAVSNTGIALHKLGMEVSLVGKVSDDYFGHLTLSLLSKVDPTLAEGVIQTAGETSSYTIVINPPGTDRTFLHCPGTNDTFDEHDIDWNKLAGARHFHFGYPPLMEGMYADGGERLSGILRTAKEKGMTVSLDMALPGTGTAAYSADWIGILTKTLPYVDVFMPSLEEIVMMVAKEQYEAMVIAGDKQCETMPVTSIQELVESLLALGCGMVVLKLGASGLYMRSSRRLLESDWQDRELWAPCFRTHVAGTTGAGDCTIAGFLRGFLSQLEPELAMTGAVAVGAHSVEQPDATSGVQPWETVQAAIYSGRERLPVGKPMSDWHWQERPGIWIGPADSKNVQENND